MLDEIQKILSQEPFTVVNPVEASTEIRKLPGWDSYKHLSLILMLEEKLGRSFAPDDIAKLKTFGDILERMNNGSGRS